ncbi:unnamed protein product [Paramecium sonneborni]|uniref:non-specific serine/threonine protein kinase n=1 Tax=Paramecium sonneborni TaxID=65129 RepID=A0A8S1LEV6_9CILI|nr:unnamed protein product [Paramecium sonneborni]
MKNSKQLWFMWSQSYNLNQKYEMETKKVLGSGKFGQVLKVKERLTKIYKAIRTIPKAKVKHKEKLKSDINQLKNINHENVIKIYELYEDDRNLHIVIDLCEGGSLFEKILEKYVLSAEEARQLFLQMIQSINICHKYALCHRDLRPESFLYIERKAEDMRIKAVDFGFQLLYVDDYIKKQNGIVVESSRSGKLYYTAPEIFEGRLTEKCDIWAVGVIFHVLLTGELPFNGQTDADIYKQIQNYEITLKVEKPIADLLSKILIDPYKRISIFDILKHPWIQTPIDKTIFLNPNFKQMKELSNQNHLLRIMMNFLSEQLQKDSLEKLKKIFEELDVNSKGFISVSSIKETLKDQPEYEDINLILEHSEILDDKINYQNFINQIYEKRLFLKEEKCYLAFKQFDLNNTGKITVENLQNVLKSVDQLKFISKQFCESLIKEVDKNNDGEIDYLEFIDMFCQKI